MNNNEIVLKDLVLIGGGHSHVHVIKSFGMKPMKNIRVTLITRDISSPYSGMLPGFIAGYYTHEECHIDVNKLCRFGGVRLINSEVINIDIVNKMISCNDDRPLIHYDLLSIDIGISPKILSNNLKNQVNITPVKPIDKYSLKWNEILNRIMKLNLSKPINISIVGGGGGGVELAFAIHHRLNKELRKFNVDNSLINVTIIHRNDLLMSTHNSNVQNIINRLCIEKGINVVLNTEIIDVIYEYNDDNTVTSHLISLDGRQFLFDEAIWCTEAIAQPWILDTGLETTTEGFICVNRTLESTNTKDIFASGDVAHLVNSPRPKAGVFAVRAGPPLADNLRRRLLNQPLEDWTPQEQFLGIIGTGDEYAVASKGPLGIEGKFLWKLKDKIDRKFMANFQILPDIESMMKNKINDSDSISDVAKSMDSSVLNLLSKASMRCGGCGSKVGSQLLSRVLNQIYSKYNYTRPEVVSKSGDDAALVIPPDSDSYLVHSIDYFKCNLSDAFIFGQISATHSLSDIFAMNAEPVSALALCVIPYGVDSKIEETLLHMLSGAMTVLKQENCALIGGHTSEGNELSMGFSVNGVVHKHKVLPKGPLIDGYALVLTKPLGTGVLGAADMRGKASGNNIISSIKSMLLSNRSAVNILSNHGAIACTDITGFGLVGHLLEMLQYDTIENSVGVELFLDQIPLLDGAIECIELGITSTLQPQNIRSARAIINNDFGIRSKKYPLLFDPQTSGGLLAAIPFVKVDSTINELISNGYDNSRIIGRTVNKQILFSDFNLTNITDDDNWTNQNEIMNNYFIKLT